MKIVFNSAPIHTVSKVTPGYLFFFYSWFNNIQSLTLFFFLMTENYVNKYAIDKSIKPTSFLCLWLDSSEIAAHKWYPIKNLSCLEETRKKVGQKLNRTAFLTLHLASIQWFFLYLQNPIKLNIKIPDIKGP